ncbi:TetR/AcrR family transcriptional regulator [Fulvivirga ligni]|uniref:TetR/AcrR family transcriptional regulator n=1 Tax=Fulvivirga ligni TaxID=2904246 RepID=UPI001F44931C|nr:TetR/AcrR family transcriptional regulator [Fulvivirga ligni]UII22283.1 TetR/AcrR family transcriptional regulator [Fulvivirga ligni]
MKEKIKKAALRLFLKYGPKRATIDDVIWELQISKKLFYEHFENKEQLIYEIFTEVIEEAKSKLSKIEHGHSENLFLLMAWQYQFYQYLKQYSEPCVYEINKYYEPVTAQYQLFRKNVVFKRLITFAKKAQKEGVISKDVDLRVFVELQLYLLEDLLFGRLNELNKLSEAEKDRYAEQIIMNNVRGTINSGQREEFEISRDKVKKYEGSKSRLF